MILQFDDLHQRAVGRQSAESHAVFFQAPPVVVVDLIAMAVTLDDDLGIVDPPRQGTVAGEAGVGAQPHGAAFLGDAALRFHDVNHRIGGIDIKLRTVGVFDPTDIPGKFDHRTLQPQTDAEEGNALLAGIAHRLQLPFDAAVAKSVRHQDGVHILEMFLAAAFHLECFRIDPAQVDGGIIGHAGMHKRFHDAFVSVMELGIFTADRHRHLFFRIFDLLHDLFQVVQVRRAGFEVELIDHQLVEFLRRQLQRHLVDGIGIHRLDHRLRAHVAEQGDLFLGRFIDRTIGAADQEVRLDPDLTQAHHAVLGRLGFEFPRHPDKRQQGQVHGDGVGMAGFQAKLPHRFQKRQTLDIAYRPPHFHDDHIGIRLAGQQHNTLLDLIGDVGDHLHRSTKIIAPPLFRDHSIVNLPGGHIVHLRHVLIDKALVMSQIEVGLRPIFGNKHFTMLVGAHRPRIHIQVGIEFHDGDLEAARFQQQTQGSTGNSLAQRRHDPAGRNDKFSVGWYLVTHRSHFLQI